MKNFLLLLQIVLFEIVGNGCLSHGMRIAGSVSLTNPSAIFAIGIRALANPWVIIGVVLVIGYFLSFLSALSRLELSYVLPMTASGYVLTTFVAKWALGESVSANRWLGTFIISLGIALVGWSERKDANKNTLAMQKEMVP